MQTLKIVEQYVLMWLELCLCVCKYSHSYRKTHRLMFQRHAVSFFILPKSE